MSLLPIRSAAKQVHRGRGYIRKLIDAGEVTAYKFGGSEKEPWLRVDPVEVEAAIKRTEIYIPEGMKRAGARSRPRRETLCQLHPAAAAM
jgi:hypothetical protein